MTLPAFVKKDPWLEPHLGDITHRINQYNKKLNELTEIYGSLPKAAENHKFFGVHNTKNGWIIREWAPHATQIFLVGNFSNWKSNPDFEFIRKENDVWELEISNKILQHKDLFQLHIFWNGGDGLRLPSYINRVVQDDETKIFTAQIWQPEEKFIWTDADFKPEPNPIIYEAHVGMSSQEEIVSTFSEFKELVLPRIIEAGYNTIQLMAIQEHPYYGSFGYHVSNYFAVSSRFGTPEELKALINEAHENGIAVIMDIVHSHAVKNENEGLSNFDGTTYQYFHEGGKGEHPAWDSKCFNYGKNEVITFLLSNCRYWLEEFHFDGFRFDGVTSMLYEHHGLGHDFTCYADYYDGTEDGEAITYLTLANQLIHTINPKAISVAEDMSGMPGLAESIENGGLGFDYRLSMGIPDIWIKMIKEKADEDWSVSHLYHELTQHREGEKNIAYCESHDQALVGDKTIIFRLLDKEMYYAMSKDSQNLIVDRGIALHKMIRLVTFATSLGGYLNFMGNEFGHPEWIDFPREGNGWSCKYARRQWNLMDNLDLKYHWLSDFDKEMIEMGKEKIMNTSHCNHIATNDNDQVMAFMRGKLLFVFNFSPSQSFPDYGISVPRGKYKIILNTDSQIFGGFGLVDDSYLYLANPIYKGSDHYQVQLYLPARTGIVYEFRETKSVH